MLVIGEEFLHLCKSKPVIIAADIIWMLVGIAYAIAGDHVTAGAAVRHNLLEYGELMLFLLAAMTYINVLQERNMFAALFGQFCLAWRYLLRLEAPTFGWCAASLDRDRKRVLRASTSV